MSEEKKIRLTEEDEVYLSGKIYGVEPSKLQRFINWLKGKREKMKEEK